MFLDGEDWTLIGWRRHDWELARTPAAGKVTNPDVAPVAARVPGSVRGALLAAGVVADPTVGVQSREAEWVEHRDWEFRRDLPDGLLDGEDALTSRLWLECEELDYTGVVLLGDLEVGRFAGSFTPHSFDLTAAYREGERRLRVILTGAPDGLAQNGWTSRILAFKPRFSYGWDWTPRMVSAGVPGRIRLERRPAASPAITARVRADVDPARDVAVLEVTLSADRPLPAGARADVLLGDEVVGSGPAPDFRFRAEVAARVWQLAGRGDQPLYDCRVRVVAQDGSVLHESVRRVGFRHVSWSAAAEAPPGADDWLCSVNGEPVFLAGVNWVPIRPDYADLTEADYRLRLQRYRDLGFVMVRVWGGAGLERPVFYDLCDELGLLVWQEFPLSSSGLDNEPPADLGFIDELAQVAESYIERLGHHACLALWCGGNELTIVDEPGVPGTPLAADHPTLAALAEVARRGDPGRRFIATSPTGPRFEADAGEFGQGLHHDVHGPWEFEGTQEQWQQYWDHDDAVMRSEVGVVGASSWELLDRQGLLAASSGAELRQLWTHAAGWWLAPLDAWLQAGHDLSQLPEWVEQSRTRQAEMLAYSAQRSKERFPRCTGYFVWLGHDTFPCPVSLSLLDYDGELKPAARALGAIFTA
ncbi:beta-mannosidase [Bogoriella caseilytica]|uniref:Beta-mannosidase n=2 Tax=Bogoriella caseilytica TaxID=56055 RepID=A0A3N2BDY7_9MICO|nr:beta-mannosidase [Bogoriella caseilytica]